MIKRFLPLIFASVCLMATPVYAAEPVDAIVPVSCSAEGSTESFAVSIEGDSGFKAPERLELRDGESKTFTIQINLPGDYKYKIYQEKGIEKNMEYDNSVYQAEIFVTEDENEKLNAETVVFTKGSSEKSAKCEFVNKVTKNEDGGSQGGSGSNGGIGGGSATVKGDTSGTARVKTGVETHELLYAGIGMVGMLTVAIVVKKKNRKTKR